MKMIALEMLKQFNWLRLKQIKLLNVPEKVIHTCQVYKQEFCNDYSNWKLETKCLTPKEVSEESFLQIKPFFKVLRRLPLTGLRIT